MLSFLGVMHWLFSCFSYVGIIQELQKNLREHCTKTQASEKFRPAPGTVCCSLFSGEPQAPHLNFSLGYKRCM